MDSGPVPLVFAARARLGAIINEIVVPVNKARDYRNKGKGTALTIIKQLKKLAEALSWLSESIDANDTDSTRVAVSATQTALKPILADLPSMEKRAKRAADVVVSLSPALDAIIEGSKLMVDVNAAHEKNHFSLMAAAITQTKPRPLAGPPMLQMSATKRATPTQPRSGAGLGKPRRGGSRRRGKSSGRGGK